MSKFNQTRSSKMKNLDLGQSSFSFGANKKNLLDPNGPWDVDALLAKARLRARIVEWRVLPDVPDDPNRGKWYYLAVNTAGRWGGYVTIEGFYFYGLKDGVINLVSLNPFSEDFKNDFKFTFNVDYDYWRNTLGNTILSS